MFLLLYARIYLLTMPQNLIDAAFISNLYFTYLVSKYIIYFVINGSKLY